MTLSNDVVVADGDDAVRRTQATPTISVPLLVLAVVLFFPFGIPAVLRWRRSRRPGASRAEMLRHLAKARLLVWYAFGAFVSCLIVALLVSIFVLNDFAVAKDYLNPANLKESMPGILKAFRTNLLLSIVAFATSVAWGLILAMIRAVPGRAAAPIRMMATAYIDIFRGLPSLLTILIIAFGLPQTGLPVVSGMSIFASGTLALTLLNGAYLAEVFRAGIESVHPSQSAAARAMGLNHLQTMRYVVLPQAVMRIIPPLLSWYISILKETSLLSVIGLLEAVNITQIMVTNQSNLSAMTGVAACFLVITIPLSRLADYLVNRSNRLRTTGR